MTEADVIYKKVESILVKVRPYLQRDGGDCELIEVDDGIVRIRLLGACHGCPSATVTLKAGIEQVICEELPEIKAVEQVF